MPNCEICDQELVEGNFEEELGICVNCIMIDCRKESFKSFLSILMLILGGFAFIVSFLLVVYIVVAFLFVDFEGYIFYLIPPLIVCVISGSGIIYFSVVFKFKQFLDNKIPEQFFISSFKYYKF